MGVTKPLMPIAGSTIPLIPIEWDLAQTSGKFAYAREEETSRIANGVLINLAADTVQLRRNSMSLARNSLISNFAIYRSHVARHISQDDRSRIIEKYKPTNDGLPHIEDHLVRAMGGLANFIGVETIPRDDETPRDQFLVLATDRLHRAADGLMRFYKMKGTVEELEQQRMDEIIPGFALEMT